MYCVGVVRMLIVFGFASNFLLFGLLSKLVWQLSVWCCVVIVFVLRWL